MFQRTASFVLPSEGQNQCAHSTLTLTGLTVNPGSQFGIFTAQGTITLSGPADSAAVVSLVSSNSSVAGVPASVAVPAGATSTNFVIALQPVAADTPVTILAGMGGVSQSAPLVVLKALDSVQITRADYTVKSFQLRLEVTGSNASATLTAWNTATGALIGTLSPGSGGKYTGTFTTGAVQNVTVKSSLGGSISGVATQK